jgi:hypothetical protein
MFRLSVHRPVLLADTLNLWWWGEQEVAGMTGWINETIAEFEKQNPKINVEATLQATEVVLRNFNAPLRAEAGCAVQVNGIYHLPGFGWYLELEPRPASSRANVIAFRPATARHIASAGTRTQCRAMNKKLYQRPGKPTHRHVDSCCQLQSLKSAAWPIFLGTRTCSPANGYSRLISRAQWLRFRSLARKQVGLDKY